MNDEKEKYANQIIPKKNQKTGDEEVYGKKGKKTKKSHQPQKQTVEIEKHQYSEPIEPPRSTVTHKNTKNQPKISDEKIFSDLCCLLSEYRQGTILKVLQETDFDKEEAYNQLLMMEPDNQRQQQEEMWGTMAHSKSKSLKNESEDLSTSSTPSEMANTIMNEVFDTFLKEEINGRQFEQLFQQIALMIKQDQQEKGVGVLEINNFVDQCYTIKQTLLVGFREELSNFDDFQFDQSSPLYTQTQQFVEDLISKQIKQEKKLMEDFPTLGGGGKQKNIVDKIKQQNKFKKEQQHYFTPSRNTLPKFARQTSNEMSIFNVDNKLRSQKDLITLHKEFYDVPIIDLKFIYKAFVGDYNICRQFLMKHYESKNNIKIVREVKTVSVKPPTLAFKRSHNHMREEQIDEELKHLTLDQIREELDHLFKLRQAFKLTKMKIKNSKQSKQIDRICNEQQPLIRKLSQAAKVKTIQLMAKSDPLYIDLHGYRVEEIEDLMEAITRMINEQASLGNQKVKIRTVRGKKTACLTLMTGKGIHSRGNRSVLKPALLSWCQDNGVDCDEEDDLVKIYILIK